MANAGTNYLKEYDAAPDEVKYRLVQGWMRSEPLEFFKQLRAERPVLQTPECTLVAMYADVRDMLEMPKVFTVDLYKPKMGVTGPNDGFLMAHDDDALHYREKSLMQGLLNRDDLLRVRKMVAETAERILREAGGRIELVNAYCRMVPVHLVQDYFGLNWVDRGDLIRWSYWNQYDAFNNQPFDMCTDREHRHIIERHAEVGRELKDYIAVLIVRKLIRLKVISAIDMVLDPIRKPIRRLFGMAPRQRRDDVVTRMLRSKLADEVDFPRLRMGVNAGGLLIGTIETTSQAVAQAVEYFVDRPHLLKEAKIRARQGDATAFDAMVWEALRFVPIRPDIFRQASCDVTIAKGTERETEIKAGTIVRLLIHSGMFDPYAYENPDEFDPDRNLYHNFCFGFGSHQCLGKYVGMEMVPEMVRQVVLLDDLRSDGAISYRNEDFPDRDGPFPEKFHLSWS